MTADDLYSHSGLQRKRNSVSPRRSCPIGSTCTHTPSLRSTRYACVFTRAEVLDDFDVERVESDIR